MHYNLLIDVQSVLKSDVANSNAGLLVIRSSAHTDVLSLVISVIMCKNEPTYERPHRSC